MSNKIKFIYEYLLFFLWYLWNKSRDRQTGIIMFSSILLFCGGHLQQLFVKLFLIYFHFISMFVSIYFLFFDGLVSFHFIIFTSQLLFLFFLIDFILIKKNDNLIIFSIFYFVRAAAVLNSKNIFCQI